MTFEYRTYSSYTQCAIRICGRQREILIPKVAVGRRSNLNRSTLLGSASSIGTRLHHCHWESLFDWLSREGAQEAKLLFRGSRLSLRIVISALKDECGWCSDASEEEKKKNTQYPTVAVFLFIVGFVPGTLPFKREEWKRRLYNVLWNHFLFASVFIFFHDAMDDAQAKGQ